MSAICAENLTRHFGAVCAVDHISFTVERGELFGFLGPNGAGKSTTIKLLTGQLRPSDGRATILGYDVVRQRAEVKASIGVVFEYQNLYERESGQGNLAFFARLYGVANGRIPAVLQQVGLTDHAHTPVKQYSNGLKQRLLIARALLHEPKALFLDEPTRGLDPQVARDIRALVAVLARQGVTVFLTTHYMAEAAQLCGRVAIIDQGRIVALDTPAGLTAVYGQDETTTLEDVFVRLTGYGLEPKGGS